jgi:hypothetical protein
MYIKRHAVVRRGKRYVYLRLVQAYRDERGRVRHRVLRTLGREDELKASGQLEQLMGSFARLDPPLVGVRRDVGALLLAAHFIDELDLVGTVDRALPQRGRQQLSVGEVAAALVASRLCSPSPLYDVAGWASGAAVQELLGSRRRCSTTIAWGGRWSASPSTPSMCAARWRRARSSASAWTPAGCTSI